MHHTTDIIHHTIDIMHHTTDIVYHARRASHMSGLVFAFGPLKCVEANLLEGSHCLRAMRPWLHSRSSFNIFTQHICQIAKCHLIMMCGMSYWPRKIRSTRKKDKSLSWCGKIPNQPQNCDTLARRFRTESTRARASLLPSKRLVCIIVFLVTLTRGKRMKMRFASERLANLLKAKCQ